MKCLKIIAALMLATSIASVASATRLKVGQPAPNIELVLVDGKHLHLSELRGQVVVLNYWATWCVPCRTELPLLNSYFVAANERHYPLRIFAVATEDSVPRYQLKKLFSVLSISPTDRIRGGPFANVDGLPTNYVIDKSGILRYAKAGAFEVDDLNRILIPLLNEPAAAQ
jgi:cytochrome c biogenesis protein CcmG/thiol:disulfide interchange protein DsbE